MGASQKKPKGKAAHAPKPQRQKKSKTPRTKKASECAADADDSDIELEHDDYAMLEEFGNRVEFLANSDLSAQIPDAAISQVQQKRAANKHAHEAPPSSQGRSADNTDSESGSEEEAYEKKARSDGLGELTKDTVELLPFKTQAGDLIYNKSKSLQTQSKSVPLVPGVSIIDEATNVEESESDIELDASNVATGDVRLDAQTQSRTKPQKDIGSRHAALQEAAAYHSQAERREQLTQQIAVASSKLLESPEEHMHCLRMLLELSTDADTVLQRLAVLSLCTVFKDVLPGYRIRALTAEEEETQVTKAVKRTRDYEKALVTAFQSYVTLLRRMLSKSRSTVKHHRIAVKCLNELLMSVPHFNHMPDVLQAIIPQASNADSSVRASACRALSTLLAQGQHGDIMLTAVQLTADLVKRKKCVCHPDLVRCLLVLQFKDLTKADVDKGSAALQRRYKFKKRRQREDAIAAALQEAAIAADHDQARLQQSQMLEALFELFFRVLKCCTASSLMCQGGAVAEDEALTRKKFPLLYVVLEGLGKYTDLIGLEYFTDLMAVFQQLLSSAALPLSLRMRCLLSAVDILQAQGDALNIDRKQLYMSLYRAVAECPLQLVAAEDESEEALLGAESGEGAGQKAGPAGTDSELLSLESDAKEDSCGVLVARATAKLMAALKVGDSARLAAFAKRLCACALHAEPGLSTAMVSIAARMLRRHSKLHGMLEGECVGSYGHGGFDPFASDPAEARALSSTLWELPLLSAHFHPTVAQAATAALCIGTSDAADSVQGALHAMEPHSLVQRLEFRATGDMCPIAGKVAAGGNHKHERGNGSGLHNDVLHALAVHCVGAVDAGKECGLDGGDEVLAATEELSAMFKETHSARKRRRELCGTRVCLFQASCEDVHQDSCVKFPEVMLNVQEYSSAAGAKTKLPQINNSSKRSRKKQLHGGGKTAKRVKNGRTTHKQ